MNLQEELMVKQFLFLSLRFEFERKFIYRIRFRIWKIETNKYINTLTR